MAKYLEIKNDNSEVVIDDQFQCLEVIDSFPLSQCTKKDQSDGSGVYNNWYYFFPRSIPNGAVVGISLNNMPNTNLFSFDITSTYIRFWGDGSAIQNMGLFSITKDDVVANCTLYVFDVATRGASSSGVGLEICNASNKLVYSSACNYLDTIACGSDDTTTISIPQDKVSVLIALGYDNSRNYYQPNHHTAPTGAEYTKRVGIYINNGKLTITPQTCSIAYLGESQTPEYNESTGQWTYPDEEWDDVDGIYDFSAWLAYGWLVGTIC